jgi:hypothetical protein
MVANRFGSRLITAPFEDIVFGWSVGLKNRLATGLKVTDQITAV